MPRTCATTRFGNVEVLEEDIIFFSNGIPGFEEKREWFFLGEQKNPIKWLQNFEDGSIALPVMAPQTVCPEYDAKIPEFELQCIKPENVEDLVLMSVVTIPSDARWNMSVNLRAPIVINRKLKLGCQVIAINEEYDVRHFVFTEETRRSLSQQASGDCENCRLEGIGDV